MRGEEEYRVYAKDCRESFSQEILVSFCHGEKVQRTTRLAFLEGRLSATSLRMMKVLRWPGRPRLDRNLDLSRQFKRRSTEVGPLSLS